MGAETGVTLPANPDSLQLRTLLSSALFVAAMLYFWIGISPFSSLASPIDPQQADSANLANQIVMLTMSVSVILALAVHPAGQMVMRLWPLLAIIFVWLAITAALSTEPQVALRRLAYALLTCICASGILLLPRDGATFARLLAVCVMIVLGLCYVGVIAWPSRAIHQAGDAIEAALAGDWRGYFIHKNTAAAAMVFSAFIGLYVSRRHATALGLLIFALSVVFLWKTGGKTSAAMLPVVLLATWIFERAGPFRLPLVLGVIVAFNLILMSAVLSPATQQFLNANGIDATFTDRAGIWRIALFAVSDSPLLGYGFQSFWATDAVFKSEASMGNWAVVAASAHNGYLELALTGGLPLLGLALLWAVILPCRHANGALGREVDPELTRLFIRMWLFSVFLACLESIFFSGEQMWFMMLVAIFGLQLQAQASPVRAPPPRRMARPGRRPSDRMSP